MPFTVTDQSTAEEEEEDYSHLLLENGDVSKTYGGCSSINKTRRTNDDPMTH